MSEQKNRFGRAGVSLYDMKGTRDWDASVWYRGGFRAIALPKCYIVDKAARDAATNQGTKSWDELGFFSTNQQMSVYRTEIMKTDKDYQYLVSTGGTDPEGRKQPGVYKNAAGPKGASVADIEQELAGIYGSKSIGTFTVNATDKVVDSNVDESKSGRWSAKDTSEAAKGENAPREARLVEDRTLEKDDYSNLIQRVIDDTSLGGNDAINCYWSYNEDDDIIHPQTAYNRDIADNYAVNLRGMGRVYAENIQRYQQILWMNFGLPVYKGSITSMFGGSATNARVVNRGNTLLAKVGYLAGTVIKIAFAFPLLPLYGILALADLFTTFPVSKYFEHRTAMPMYYKFCNVLIGHMAVNLGLYKAFEKDLQKTGNAINAGLKFISFGLINISDYNEINTKKTDNSNLPQGSELYQVCNVGTPEVLINGPDMLAIMYRKSMKNRMYDQVIQKKLDPSLFKTTAEAYKEYLTATSDKDTKEKEAALYATLDARRKEYDKLKSSENKDAEALKKAQDAIALAQQEIDKYEEATRTQNVRGLTNFGLGGIFKGQNWGNLFGMMMGTALQTIDYIGFKVEKSTSVSESVSNTTEPLEIAGTINGMASQGRQKKDSLLGTILSGRSGIPGVDHIAQFVSGLFGAIVDSVGMGNMVNVLAGNGFADIPERWSNSSFSRSYNVEIQLRARYGDPVSWLQSIGIPLACILAGGMPRGIGDSMYTSPFLVRCYCKGMFSIPTGIIESISMTRGDAEYGWTLSRLPLSLNIQLTIKDLSPILYIGMDNDMNTSMDEYMSTLTGLGLYERSFRFPQILRRINRAILIGRNTWANPLWWGNEIGDTGLAKLGASIYSIATGKGLKPAKNT